MKRKPKSPAQREKTRLYMKARYDARKAAGVCTACGGPREGERVMCDFCHDVDCARAAEQRKTARYRATDRKRGARLRAERKAKGLCIKCAQPAVPGKTMCEPHRAYVAQKNIEWRERKRLGVAATIHRTTPVINLAEYRQRYTPIDEIEQNGRVRILRTLQRFEWIDARDLADEIGLEGKERNAMQSMLGRFVRMHRWAEQRTFKTAMPEYRITDAGRGELARLRGWRAEAVCA